MKAVFSNAPHFFSFFITCSRLFNERFSEHIQK